MIFFHIFQVSFFFQNITKIKNKNIIVINLSNNPSTFNLLNFLLYKTHFSNPTTFNQKKKPNQNHTKTILLSTNKKIKPSSITQIPPQITQN